MKVRPLLRHRVLIYHAGESCRVFIPGPVNDENKEARPPAQARWDHKPVRELEADNQEANRVAGYLSPTVSNHPAPDGIRCDISKSIRTRGKCRG